MNNKYMVSVGTLLCCIALFSSALAWKAPEQNSNSLASQADDPFRRGFRGMKTATLSDLDNSNGLNSGWNKLDGRKVDAGDSIVHRFNRRMLKSGSEMKIQMVQEDNLGNKHYRLLQYIKGLPVIGSEIIVHVNKQNEIYLVSGKFTQTISPDTSAIIDESSVLEYAKKYANSKAVEIEGMASLVVFDSTVAYEITVRSNDPEPAKWKMYINAHSGNLISKVDRLVRAAPGNLGSHVTVTGNRLTKEDGLIISIQGWHDTLGNYFFYHKNQRWGVYNLRNSDWEQRSTSSWGTSDPSAVSLANNFAITQNFITSKFGRNSFDNSGALAQANVHEGTSYVNAYWDGSDFHFGDGDNVQSGPLTTLDISAHEYGHAITQYTSNLVYSYESGALNESFSDILGTWIEFSAQPDGRSSYPRGTAGRADWLCGEDAWLESDALRDLRDPLRFGNPSYYLGTSWYTGSGDNGGVHYNSGVQNKAFYLLAEGGSGVNDGHPYTLVGMGVDTAGQIAMYANMFLMTSSSQYRDARNAWIQAAVTLGYNSTRVSDAWAAVGILPLVSHLSASPSQLAFDSVGLGVSDTLVLSLSNNGGDATLVSSLAFSNPAFSAVTTTPFSVAGGSTLPLRVVFRPTAIGTVNGNLTITSNAQDNPVITIALSARVVNPAAITLTPGYFRRTVAVGDSTSATLTISNPGQARLNWTIAVADNLVSQTVQPQTIYDANHFVDLVKGGEDVRIGQPVTSLHGGPDRTGYTWIDSDEQGGPVYQWNDIRTTGTLLSTISGCDDCFQLQSLSFKFPFYGNSFDTMYVSSNGFITFGTGSSLISNYPLPSTSAPANLIDALHDDLYPSSGGDIYFRDYGDRAVVQFDNVYPFSGSGVYTFQIVIERSGNIFLYYNNLTGPLTGATVGIQNSARDDGLTVVYNAAYLKNSLAVKFAPRSRWLSASPVSGSISAGQSASVRVAFNGASVPGGTHYGKLDISHNAPGSPSPQSVPCTLWVDGIRRLSVTPLTLNFGSHWVGSRDSATFTLTNTGDEATVVSAISSSNQYFISAVSTPLTVPAFGSAAVKMYYQPGAIGSHNGNIVISSNAEDNPSLSVAASGTGTSAPQININPLSIAVNLSAGDTTVRSLRIRNAGGDQLSYAVGSISGGKSIVINEFSNSPDFIEIWNRGSDQDFSGWMISIVDNDGSTGSFTFPSGYVLRAGKRVVLRENTGTANDSTFYYGVNIGWVEGSAVSVTLLDNRGAGVDFVRTTNSTTLPPAGVNWYGAGVNFSLYSAYRLRNPDTDSTSDWGISSSPTEYLLNPGQSAGVVLPGWISVSPMSGNVAAGDSSFLSVVARAGGRVAGTYVDTIRIAHNAPAQATPQIVSVQMTVASARRLSVQPQIVSFGNLWIGRDSVANLTLQNSGNDTTTISNITCNNSDFTQLNSLPLRVPPFGSVSMQVRYRPSGVGNDNGVITITSNAIESAISVTLSGRGLPAPAASVRPDSLQFNLLPSDNPSSRVCHVYNAGGDTLQYQIQGINQIASPLASAVLSGSIQPVCTNLVYSSENLENEYVNGRVIIGLSPSFTSPSYSFLDKIGYTKIRELGIARNPQTGMKVNTLRPVYLVTLTDTSAGGVIRAIDQLRNDPSVAFAEPDYLLHADLTPNDPYFSQLYGMQNSGQTGGTVEADIDATDVWERHTGNRTILIGIIDTGIDYLHPDLAANIWTNPGEIAGNGIDDDHNGFIDDIHGWDFAYDDNNPTDGHYHGTHCAGTVAGVGNNGVGVAGVMWTASLVALKFLDDAGSGSTSDAIDAVNYANAMGIKITSNSWGGGAFSQALMDAIALGGLFVAAAGNSGSDNDVSPHYPSSYTLDNVLSIAATDHNDLLASFSCYGRTSVDLGAPGVSIYSCSPGTGYQTLSGTSMATPHVSGAAGLIWTYNQSLTALQVKQLLMNNTDSISALNGITITGGRLNVNKALQAAGPAWLTASPMAGGRVAPGDSAAVTMTVSPQGLAAGRWEANVVIATNDPLHSVLPVNVRADIDGYRSLSVAPAQLNFRSIWVGMSDTMQITLSNTGNEPTVVSSISSSQSAFRVSGVFPLTVGAASNVTVTVIFQPGSVGSHSGTLTINSNAEDHAVIEIPVTGAGIQGPEITVTPGSFSEFLGAGDSVSRNLTISNTGDDSLRVSLQSSVQSFSGMVDTHLVNQLSSLQKTFTVSSTSDTSVNRVADVNFNKGSAVPGYGNNVLIIQDQYPWGYNVIQPILSSLGAVTTTISSSQMASQNFNLYNVIVIPSVQTSAFYSNFRLNKQKFDTFVQAGGVLEFHCATQGDSLTLPAGMRVLYSGSPTNRVVNRNHPITAGVDTILNGSSASHTYFSAVPANATVLVNNAVNQPTLVTYQFGSGIVVATGMTWEYYYPSGLGNPLMPNALAYCINGAGNANWLTVNSSSVVVAAHSTVNVNVSFNAGNINGGEHTGEITITHNATGSISPITVPCTLTVDGMRRLSAQPASLNFETLLAGRRDTLLLTLKNSGNEATQVQSISSSLSSFTVAGSFPVTVQSQDSLVVSVIFAPVRNGNYTGTLTINSNAEDNPIISVAAAGNAIAGPSISVSPQQVNVRLASGTNAQRTVSLANTGDADLVWRINQNNGQLISREIHDTIPGIQSRSFTAVHDLDCSYWSDGGSDAFDGFGYPTVSVGGVSSSVCMREGDSSYTVNGYRIRVRNDFAENHIYRSIIEPQSGENTNRSDITVNLTGNMGSDGSETVYLDSVQVGGQWLRFYVNEVSFPNSDPRVVFLIVPSKIEQRNNVSYWRPSSGNVSMEARNISLPATVYIIPSYHSLASIKSWFQSDIRMMSSWLTVSPDTGTTHPGQLSNLSFAFNTTGLTEGLYFDTIKVTHNSMTQTSPLLIPVMLQVGGSSSRVTGYITTIGVSTTPYVNGTRYRIVDMRIGSQITGIVQGTRFKAFLK